VTLALRVSVENKSASLYLLVVRQVVSGSLTRRK